MYEKRICGARVATGSLLPICLAKVELYLQMIIMMQINEMI